MSPVNYRELAQTQLADEASRAADQAIAQRASDLKIADERAAELAAVRAKHGLPDTATLREMSDAEMAYARGWRDFVACRFGGNAQAVEILSPEICTDERRPQVQAKSGRLRAEFESAYDAKVAAKTGRQVAA